MAKIPDIHLQPGAKLTLHYEIFWQGNKLVFSTKDQAAIKITIGDSDLLPSLEEAIMENAEKKLFSVTLEPEQCYGLRDEDLYDEVPVESIPVEARVNGARIVAIAHDGEERDVLISHVNNTKGTCMVDFNHPLAGKKLTFNVEILSVDS